MLFCTVDDKIMTEHMDASEMDRMGVGDGSMDDGGRVGWFT